MIWMRPILQFMLAVAVYRGVRWARYVWLVILGFFALAALLLLALVLMMSDGVRELNDFSAFGFFSAATLLLYSTAFFYSLTLSRDVLAFLDAQRT
jgi:hypothetical protein